MSGSLTGTGTVPRILVVRVGAMGDVLHGMPAVAALRAAIPDAVIGWAIEPCWAPLLCADTAETGQASLPLVDTVHLVAAKAWSQHPISFETVRSIQSLRHALRSERYDVAIDLQGSIRSGLIAKASGALQITGSATPREAPVRWLYTQRVTLTQQHVVEQAAEIVSAAMRLQLLPAPVPLPVDSAADDWCETFLSSDMRRTVFLAPTAGWGAKQWPAEQYGELARRLSSHGYRVLVNAAPHGDDAVALQVIEASNDTAQLAACTLPQLIALLRRVLLVIAGDSGPLHLAAALDVPVVAIFGPTDPARNGPYAGRATVLRHASSQTDHRRHTRSEAGLQRLEVAEVLAAALQQLKISERTHG